MRLQFILYGLEWRKSFMGVARWPGDANPNDATALIENSQTAQYMYMTSKNTQDVLRNGT